LVDLGSSGRRKVIGHALALERKELLLFQETLVEVGAERGDDPNAACRHELGQELRKMGALCVAYLPTEQFVELIDNDEKFGANRAIEPTLLLFGLADFIEGADDRLDARLVGMGQEIGELGWGRVVALGHLGQRRELTLVFEVGFLVEEMR